MDFRLKWFHKFEILIDKIKNLRANLKYDLNFMPFYVIALIKSEIELKTLLGHLPQNAHGPLGLH